MNRLLLVVNATIILLMVRHRVEPAQQSEIKMNTSIQEKFNIHVIDYDFFR